MHQVQPAAASSSQLYQHSPYSCAVKTTLPRSSIKLPCISYPAGYLPHSDQAPEHSPTTHVNFLRLCLYPSTSPASPHGPSCTPPSTTHTPKKALFGKQPSIENKCTSLSATSKVSSCLACTPAWCIASKFFEHPAHLCFCSCPTSSIMHVCKDESYAQQKSHASR